MKTKEKIIEELMKKFDSWYDSYVVRPPKSSIQGFMVRNTKKALTEQRKSDLDEIIEIVGTFTPTCGHESEEEKGFQKGIQAEQNLIKDKINHLVALKENK